MAQGKNPQFDALKQRRAHFQNAKENQQAILAKFFAIQNYLADIKDQHPNTDTDNLESMVEHDGHQYLVIKTTDDKNGFTRIDIISNPDKYRENPKTYHHTHKDATIRIFHEGNTNSITEKEFLERGHSLIDAAEELVKQYNPEALADVERVREAFENKIKRFFSLEPGWENTPEGRKEFKRKYKAVFKEYLKLQAVLIPLFKNKLGMKQSEARAALRKKEIELVTRSGRPTTINLFSVKPGQSQQPIWRFSANIPYSRITKTQKELLVKYHNGLENVKQYYNLSDDELAITKPTINRGELGFDGVGISNGVSHVMGNFNWQTPEVVATHEVKVTKTVERSASIPPIDKHHHYSDDDSDIQTKKRILRRLYCAHNFEQILENLIEQQTDEEEVKANATQSIYEFTLAENTLLSPLGNKAFNKVVAGPFMSHNESEARQHKEELRVLRAYAAKDHFELNIHGKTVKVKLNLLPINTPVNLNGFKQAVKKAGNPWSTFEKHLNKETIYHLGLEVGNYLKMIEDELMMTPEFEKNNFSNSMLNLLSAFTREHKPINDRNFTRLKEELSNEYELYYSFLLQITNTHDLDKNITEDAVNKLDQTTATIKDLEKQLYVHYDGHYRNERKEWTSHKKSAEKRLIEFLSEQITNNSNIDETTLNKYKLVRDIAEIYYAIKDLYYGKHFKKPKHAYHLVQKYAQLCDLINIPILVHCKSGKDRTGSAVDHAEVEDIYKQFKDRYYQFDSGNENYDDLFIKIAKVIDFAGASLENCRLNAPGAKAEQVDNPFSYHKLLHKKLRKLVSLTAKEIYLDSNSIFGYSPSVDYYCLPNAIKTAREELKSLLSQPNSQNDTTTANMQQAIGAGQTLLSTLAKRSPNKHIYQASDYCTNVLNNPTSLAAALESMGITPYRVTQQAGIKVKKPKPASADLTENSMRLHKFKNIAYTETVNKLEVIYHNKNVSNADKQTLTAIHKMYLDFKAQHPDTTEITIYGSDADLVKKCLSVANVLKINAKIDLKNINDPAEIRAIETLCDECTQIETSLINHVKQNDNQELNRMNNPIKLEQSQNPHNLTV